MPTPRVPTPRVKSKTESRMSHKTPPMPTQTSARKPEKRRVQLSRIVLHLARDKGFPEGSRRHGYEIVAPLDASGHIDPAGWRAARDRCRIRRFWAGEDEFGRLVRMRGGSWAFHYDDSDDPADDEVGYRFADHAFEIGEYVSIRDEDGDVKTFRVVSVSDVEDLPH